MAFARHRSGETHTDVDADSQGFIEHGNGFITTKRYLLCDPFIIWIEENCPVHFWVNWKRCDFQKISIPLSKRTRVNTHVKIVKQHHTTCWTWALQFQCDVRCQSYDMLKLKCVILLFNNTFFCPNYKPFICWFSWRFCLLNGSVQEIGLKTVEITFQL